MNMIDAIRRESMKPGQVRLGVSLAADLVDFVKVTAKEAGVTQSDVVTYALRLRRSQAAPSLRDVVERVADIEEGEYDEDALYGLGRLLVEELAPDARAALEAA